MRYHIGLVTPNDPKCFINVDGERYFWKDGEAVMFDETYIHFAANETDQQRIILFCDVERPVYTKAVELFNRWFGRYVIQSPLHHRKHHILEKAQWGTNYAIMPIWDHLFGTYAAPALPEDPIGVDTAYNQGFGFWKDLVRDYLDFGMAVLAPIRDWVKRASPAISDHHETRP